MTNVKVKSKKLRDFILMWWVYDKVYKNETIQLIDINTEIKKFRQDLEDLAFKHPNIIEISDVIKILNMPEIKENVLLKKLDSIAQNIGDVEVYGSNILDVLSEKAALLLNEVKKIITIIKNTSAFNQAEKYFILLDKIQTQLATFVFKENLEIDNEIRAFINDFDRLDDLDLRIYLYKKIKENAYDFSELG